MVVGEGIHLHDNHIFSSVLLLAFLCRRKAKEWLCEEASSFYFLSSSSTTMTIPRMKEMPEILNYFKASSLSTVFENHRKSIIEHLLLEWPKVD